MNERMSIWIILLQPAEDAVCTSYDWEYRSDSRHCFSGPVCDEHPWGFPRQMTPAWCTAVWRAGKRYGPAEFDAAMGRRWWSWQDNRSNPLKKWIDSRCCGAWSADATTGSRGLSDTHSPWSREVSAGIIKCRGHAHFACETDQPLILAHILLQYATQFIFWTRWWPLVSRESAKFEPKWKNYIRYINQIVK